MLAYSRPGVSIPGRDNSECTGTGPLMTAGGEGAGGLIQVPTVSSLNHCPVVV